MAGEIMTGQFLKPHWHERTASKKMIGNVPVVFPQMSLEEVHKYVVKNIDQFDSINYIYVVDGQKKLVGIFHEKDLFKLPGETIVGQMCNKAPVTVRPDASQEKAAHLAMEHSLKAIPVVDENHVFLGVIPSENILSIIYREAREDILQLAGIHKGHFVTDDIMKISLFDAFKHRVPWLVIGLFGGILAASVTGYFEKTLEKNILLVAFIPLIVYMADAVGTQMESFAIRDFSIPNKLDHASYFMKQFMIVFVIAVFLSIVFGALSLFIYHSQALSFVLVISLFLTMISSVFTGLIIPFFFTKLKQDPANASGPIATIIQDVLSVLIYFYIASMLL